MNNNISELVTGLLNGNEFSIARMITLIEKERIDLDEFRSLIYPNSNKSYRIGITGPTGAGKSSLIDKLISKIRSKQFTVALLAIDPSSSITGGAVLGDRIRMQKHYLDEGVFIRSMATRGSCGGLSCATELALDLLDASGKDIIILETTGVGQTEIEVRKVVDTVVLILVPGFGDTIQLMKAGLLEIADIVLINKSDLDGATIFAEEVSEALGNIDGEVRTPVILSQAITGDGIDGLFREIEKRWAIKNTGPEREQIR
jgi:LAO/AO transport system kinase